MPFIIAIVPAVFYWFTSEKNHKENLKESKKSNTLGMIGIGLGAVTTIAMIMMLFIQSPDNPEDFDVVSNHEDGTLHYIGNGSYEDREGEWMWYSNNGILIKLATYSDNELDGKYKEFYNNGNIKIDGEYNDGEKDLDEWKYYNLDGSIKRYQESVVTLKHD